MNFDFAALLVGLAAFTGIVWGIDALFFAKARAERAQAGSSLGTEVVREPVIVEYSRSFFPVILIVLIVRSFLAEPFRIPSSSMMPNLQDGDFILVNKFTYGLRLPVLDTKIVELGEPQRGDVVVFRYPVNPKENYIKRVIGLPGDEVVYRNKTLFINGEPQPQERIGRYIGVGAGREMDGADHLRETLGEREHEILMRPTQLGRQGEGRWVVPEGHYFVMGDNRDNSLDSRAWGFVPERNLVGRAFLIWFNSDFEFGRIGQGIE
ncbi:signal peptidase I [Aquimonas voraii]|uniref:Signal peptidase I n=1 Tax=Aquimonas voraii TaxID=265719 RepID=A0A1G6SJM3_9GAMM|nr:signal peptidase I [Aquimonas voraii]SDD17112.1 signal peptidase I Serine peptidase. MEROPS family S26A [Aquimonas voraii]